MFKRLFRSLDFRIKKIFFQPFFGKYAVWKEHRRLAANPPGTWDALQIISSRWPDVKSQEQSQPIFILSAGWRAGSTLLQRIIMSKANIIIWGEPYSHTGLIKNMARPITAFTAKWPRDDWFVEQFNRSELPQTWVANLYPSVKALLNAQIGFFKILFQEPAEQLGFSQWGIKDVRLTIDDAFFLQWLFPRAKFLFLYRNPYDCYRSYRFYGYWYKQWPDKPTFTPRAFGEHWKSLLAGFLSGYQRLGGKLIKYEDLCTGKVSLDDLESYLEIEIDKSILDVKVGSTKSKVGDIPFMEKYLLKKAVEPLASELDYS